MNNPQKLQQLVTLPEDEISEVLLTLEEKDKPRPPPIKAKKQEIKVLYFSNIVIIYYSLEKLYKGIILELPQL